MYSIITFDSEQHRDNENTRVIAPFASADDAHRWAEANCKFWHITPLTASSSFKNGGLRITSTPTIDVKGGAPSTTPKPSIQGPVR